MAIAQKPFKSQMFKQQVKTHADNVIRISGDLSSLLKQLGLHTIVELKKYEGNSRNSPYTQKALSLVKDIEGYYSSLGKEYIDPVRKEVTRLNQIKDMMQKSVNLEKLPLLNPIEKKKDENKKEKVVKETIEPQQAKVEEYEVVKPKHNPKLMQVTPKKQSKKLGVEKKSTETVDKKQEPLVVKLEHKPEITFKIDKGSLDKFIEENISSLTDIVFNYKSPNDTEKILRIIKRYSTLKLSASDYLNHLLMMLAFHKKLDSINKYPIDEQLEKLYKSIEDKAKKEIDEKKDKGVKLLWSDEVDLMELDIASNKEGYLAGIPMYKAGNLWPFKMHFIFILLNLINKSTGAKMQMFLQVSNSIKDKKVNASATFQVKGYKPIQFKQKVDADDAYAKLKVLDSFLEKHGFEMRKFLITIFNNSFKDYNGSKPPVKPIITSSDHKDRKTRNINVVRDLFFTASGMSGDKYGKVIITSRTKSGKPYEMAFSSLYPKNTIIRLAKKQANEYLDQKFFMDWYKTLKKKEKVERKKPKIRTGTNIKRNLITNKKQKNVGSKKSTREGKTRKKYSEKFNVTSDDIGFDN